MIATTTRTRRDEGAALVIVIAVGAVVALLMTLLVTVSVNGTKQARGDANWNAALAAAYAGVDEYQSRLSADTSYWRYGNSTSAFSSTSTVNPPPVPNPAFGVGAGGSWATVALSGDRAMFRYEVDNSHYANSGRIRVRATGKVGEATRTVVADLKQEGFIDFLYFTDYEVQDPSLTGTTNSGCFTDSTKTTLKYSWQGRTTANDSAGRSVCKDLAFGEQDLNDGPVHSNDTIRACGTTFTGIVTTGNATSPYYRKRNSNNSTDCDDPSFAPGYPAYSGGVKKFPATNSQLKKEARTDLTADVPRPGCLYTGPTQFTFTDDGKVNIKSPFTKFTRIGNEAATVGSAPVACGLIAQLQSPAGATIVVPDNNVLYVQNVPAVSSDVNFWASNPTGFSCKSSGASGERGWSIGTDTAKSGYPVRTSTTSTTEVAPTATTYGCRAGDIFVKGRFSGAATIAAENYVFIVGDITYVDIVEDILGIVGNNAVWVWNPVNSSNNTLLGNNRTIHAAILSVAHTFQVQNYDKGGTQGTLNVRGAIAQKFRGTVAMSSGGTITHGYAKNYLYDDRFKVEAPPKFLNPVTTTYGVTTWVEIGAVWAADGAAR
ncbi:hypothetical protein [Microbacterium sp. zg-YB36]|uniref:hypothetical protein n=1 Tax=Microbacterium sp. zg-YB36 TaxID=2969407 RepID=UPI00214BEEEE|nr:hypothetical protein [Microbacterium sp. zg-YB36]MDL5349964.1 hypothetical protein [Microbacterium sp. zg-YB36]